MAKRYSVSKTAMVREHKSLIPKLRSHGLKKEAKEQAKELRSIKKK